MKEGTGYARTKNDRFPPYVINMQNNRPNYRGKKWIFHGDEGTALKNVHNVDTEYCTT